MSAAAPRRTWLLGAAVATSAAVASPTAASGVPSVASPEITAAIAAYRARLAEANVPRAGDEVVAAKCDEMEDAAARLAASPCRSLADLAAKIAFFVEVMNHENGWGAVTSAEGDVLVSVEDGVLALLDGRSA